jgi:hypothetical protein
MNNVEATHWKLENGTFSVTEMYVPRALGRRLLTGIGSVALLLLLFSRAAGAFAGEATEKARFQAYKHTVMQDPSLIRFYIFEAGHGDEVSNHVLLNPTQTAVTGGTLGSLTIQRYRHGMNSENPNNVSPGTVSPDWSRGRWPWKAAVTSGLDTAKYAWQVTKLFRSGITGAEFASGGTLAGWIRIHENPAPAATCNILTLGNGWGNGFILKYVKGGHNSNGALEFRLGVANGQTPRADLHGGPFSAGVWRQFAVTVDGAAAKLYLDGELKAEKPFAATVIPTAYKDFPQVGPFYENNSPTRWGEFLMIAHNVPRKGRVINRFDLDELAIYKRALSAKEIGELELAGRPAMSASEQLSHYREQMTRQRNLDRIRMSIPLDTGGYFRINQPIAATVEIPAETGLRGRFKFVVELESLDGQPVKTWKRNVRAGKSRTVKIKPPECGVYYLNMRLLASDGSLLKKLPLAYCLGIVPPAPRELTAQNPLAFWAEWDDRFHYDAPIRRMNYFGDGKQFLKNYETYSKRIPNFRAYVFFHCGLSAIDAKLIGEAAEKMKGKNVFGVELTSEPHNVDIKAYVDMLKTASEIFRAELPGVQLFPPGGAPPSIPMINKILKNGGINYLDGVSYHPYTSNPIGSFLWDSLTDKLKKVLAQYPEKKLTLWNTEGGLNSLPRINGRPMTRKDAHAARFPSAKLYEHQFFTSFISMRPELEAAAMQCHAILLDMLAGYKIYTLCQTPNVNGQPSLRGVALTALAGQVLNTQTAVTRLKLSTLENMCLLIKNADETTTAAVFSMEPATVNFKLKPKARYRTMDLLGNYGTIKANAVGLITVKSQKAPLYIFDVPFDLQEVVPLRLTAPEVLSEKGRLEAKLTVSNPFSTPLIGTLSTTEIRGATIELGQTAVHLAPGTSQTIAVELRAQSLKRRRYLMQIDLKDRGGALVSSAQAIFQSRGVVQMVPRIKAPIQLDGEDIEWGDIPGVICDDPDSVVHGKPNYAEMWVPQWKSKDDLSCTIKTAWRKGDGIYFLLKVRDNVLKPAPDDKIGLAFRYDCLELFFDSRPYSKQGTVISPGADQVVVVPQVGEHAAACKFWYAKKNHSHLNLTCMGRKTTDGYLIEGKLVPNANSEFQIRAGSQFRMDFLIDDTDSLDPKWMRKSAMALHGKFSNYNNSDVWGRYELSLDK